MSAAPKFTPEQDQALAALDARDSAYKPQLQRIGNAIGYGNACHILGELWDDRLEQCGLPRGRGRMERRPHIESREAMVDALRTIRDITSPGLAAASAYYDMDPRERLADIHCKALAALAKAEGRS